MMIKYLSQNIHKIKLNFNKKLPSPQFEYDLVYVLCMYCKASFLLVLSETKRSKTLQKVITQLHTSNINQRKRMCVCHSIQKYSLEYVSPHAILTVTQI